MEVLSNIRYPFSKFSFSMILAFQSITDPIVLQLFEFESEGENSNSRLQALNFISEKEIFKDPKKRRPDILLAITEFLEENKTHPKEIQKILFVKGPGSFSNVRAACTIANTFAKELGITLLPITTDFFEEYEENFEKLLKAYNDDRSLIEDTNYVEAVFGKEPKITMKKE